MRRKEKGFTYVSLVILVSILGLVGAFTLKVESLARRARAEKELLEIGAEFSRALQSYAAATPAGQLRFPRSLNDLLKDPRFPEARRHLRKIYVDPMTGRAEWGIVYMVGQSGIAGIHSLATSTPLKISNFDGRFQGFDNRKRYSDWLFSAPGQIVGHSAVTR